MKSLAIRYRPQTFDDVTEQGSIKTILTQQIESGDIRNAYLFCGGAGTGKTTCARIFANEVNDGNGDPIEMDAASHNSVDDVREIIKMAQTGSMTCKYKVFIIDECHSLSNQAWQAMLKLIEEPPAKSIFIFCTTDPQKIPATIISRVQRYQFQRISQDGIVMRLYHILQCEGVSSDRLYPQEPEAIEYIAKLADGGMRDAITMLDKCLAYNDILSMENVLEALNITGYDDYVKLTDHLMYKEYKELIVLLDEIYASGVDLKLFVKNYLQFILDVNKYIIIQSSGEAFKHIKIPHTKDMQKWLDNWCENDYISTFNDLLDSLIKLDVNIKWSQNVKADVEATLLLF